jgi:release factor glutamine methyltransferase
VPQSTHTDAGSWTIGGLLEWTARYLAQKGSDFPRLDAEVLLAHALGCKRIELYTRYEEAARDDVRARYRELIARRIEGCPVAYLVGRKEFYSLTFEVSPAVLIPRPESELVVLECLRLAKPFSQPRVLDLGTGSGNLAVTIAHQHLGAEVTAVDMSPEALELARRNAERHGVEGRLRLLQGDLFASLSPGEVFDFIVSNPPYIPHEEIGTLPEGVRNYEPHLALDGGPGGFVVFDKLLAGAKDRLAPGGYLILEICATLHEATRERTAKHLDYEVLETVYDGSRFPRVLVARKRPLYN